MSTPNQGEDSLNLFNWAETTPLISIIQQSVQLILCRFFLRIIFTFHMSICQHVIRKLWAPRPRSQNKNQIIHNLVALGIQPSWPCFQGRLSSYKKIRSALAFLAAGLLCSESKIVWKTKRRFHNEKNVWSKMPTLDSLAFLPHTFEKVGCQPNNTLTHIPNKCFSFSEKNPPQIPHIPKKTKLLFSSNCQTIIHPTKMMTCWGWVGFRWFFM